MNNINYDFENMCRTCLFNCDLKSIQQDNAIIEILHNLGVRFETNDALPQKICRNCFEKINTIRAFVLQCNESYSSLTKYLNNYKNIELKQEKDITEETKYEVNEIKIKEEVTIEEHKIEFVPINNYFEELSSTNLEIKQELIDETNDELNEEMMPETSDQHMNCNEDDFLISNTTLNKMDVTMRFVEQYKSDSEVEETISKRKRRKTSVNMQWVKEQTFPDKESAKNAINKEKTWSCRSSYTDASGNLVVIYRCNKVKFRGKQCAAGVRLIYISEGTEVEMHRSELSHTHNQISSKRQELFSDTVKQEIENILNNDSRVKPRRMLEILAKKGFPVPKKTQLNNYLSYLRRKK